MPAPAPAPNPVHQTPVRSPGPRLVTPEPLWPRSQWPVSVARKLAATGEVAPLDNTRAGDASDDAEECPICLEAFTRGLNTAWCCKQLICTDCFLQSQTPVFTNSCPFCKHVQFRVSFKGASSPDDIKRRHQEEHAVQEAEKRIREAEARNAGSAVRSAGKVTVAEREALQRDLAKARRHSAVVSRESPPSSPRRRGTTSSALSRASLESLLGPGSPLAPALAAGVPVETLMRSFGGDLAAIEELMIQEVLRQSMEQAQGTGVPGPPTPIQYGDSGAGAGSSATSTAASTAPSPLRTAPLVGLTMSSSLDSSDPDLSEAGDPFDWALPADDPVFPVPLQQPRGVRAPPTPTPAALSASVGLPSAAPSLPRLGARLSSGATDLGPGSMFHSSANTPTARAGAYAVRGPVARDEYMYVSGGESEDDVDGMLELALRMSLDPPAPAREGSASEGTAAPGSGAPSGKAAPGAGGAGVGGGGGGGGVAAPMFSPIISSSGAPSLPPSLSLDSRGSTP